MGQKEMKETTTSGDAMGPEEMKAASTSGVVLIKEGPTVEFVLDDSEFASFEHYGPGKFDFETYYVLKIPLTSESDETFIFISVIYDPDREKNIYCDHIDYLLSDYEFKDSCTVAEFLTYSWSKTPLKCVAAREVKEGVPVKPNSVVITTKRGVELQYDLDGNHSETGLKEFLESQKGDVVVAPFGSVRITKQKFS